MDQQRATTPQGRISTGLSSPSSAELTGAGKSNIFGSKPAIKTAAACQARPMTSSKGAGYSSGSRSESGTGAIKAHSGTTVEDHAKQLEDRVHAMLEQSALSSQQGDTASAVDAAKEATRKEQKLCSQLEQAGQADQISLDLKFAVSLNLASAYHANGQLQDALATYNQIIRSKLFPQAGWLRVNMGNIHLEEGLYAQAIKMYRMALDQLPPTLKRLRLNVMRNIGITFLRAGRFQDGVDTFASILSDGPDHQTAFNLVICCWAMRDVELLKQAFLQLCQIPPYLDDTSQDSEVEVSLGEDPLQQELAQRQRDVDRYILVAARLLAPLLAPGDIDPGYEWCREQLSQAGYSRLGSELQLARASEYMARRDYHTAIAILKDFERGDSRSRAQAAINLSTLHMLEGDTEAAAEYAEFCLGVEPDNAAALVSRGNVHMALGQVEQALQLYEDALQVDPQSMQAMYNIGLACKQLGIADRALEAMQGVLRLAPAHAEAMLLLADLYDELQDLPRAGQWFTRLACKAPHDSGALTRHGGLLARLGEEGEALHQHLEAYRVDPTNLDTISWLGAHCVRQQDYAAAIPYFRAAAAVQPKEVKWGLMIAGCLRRIGQLEQALHAYRDIYTRHSTNMECLRYLAQLSKEFDLQEDTLKFSAELQRAERLQAAAASAPVLPSPGGATGVLARRITAPGNRPSTGQTLAALGGPLVSPFKAMPRALQQAGACEAARAGMGAGLVPPPSAGVSPARPLTGRQQGEAQVAGARPLTAARPMP